MPIEFRCPQCDRLLRTPDDSAGKQAKCPECGALVEVPEASTASPRRMSAYGEPSAPAGEGKPDSQWARPFPSASPFSPAAPPDSAPGGSKNPYASPSQYAKAPPRGGHGYPDLRAYATSRVKPPAVALIVVSALSLVAQTAGMVINLTAVAGAAQADPDVLASGIGGMIGGALGAVMGVLILVGAIKMMKLESRGLAMAAAIVASIPCFSICCMGMPFGIWALVVLCDPDVRLAFEQGPPRPAAGPANPWT